MGSVYEARHTVLGKRVAIKLMHGRLLSDQKLVDRFIREGQAAAAIRHRHVLEIFDVLYHGERPYLVMSFLEGENLEARIKQSGPLPVQALVDLFLPVVSAVAAAHDRSIVHRDSKPENIVLDRGDDSKDHRWTSASRRSSAPAPLAM